jgi:thiol-disulfide isomerase/thioredoxin
MKSLLLSIFICIGFASNAQTTLTTAVDFTAKDIDGNTFNLFNKLDENKYVVIDFLFTNCGPCQNAAPKLYEAFVNYGSNSPSAQIYFVSINRDDNNDVMHSWESTYMNPTGPYPLGISGTEGSSDGGPQNFSSLYGITAYPTMILIAPNREIVEQDMWPISTWTDFRTYFQSHGLNPTIASVVNPSLLTADLSLYPSHASDLVSIDAKGNKINSIRFYDILGNMVFNKSVNGSTSIENIDVSILRSGIYFADVLLNEKDRHVVKFVKN